jgi:hypothetical protein
VRRRKCPDNAEQQEVAEGEKEQAVMFADEQRQQVIEKIPDAAFIAFMVAVYALEYARGHPVDVVGYFAVAIESFGISKVIKQGSKSFRHHIRVFGGLLPDLLPPFQVPFYK